jgi:hypothetical protein
MQAAFDATARNWVEVGILPRQGLWRRRRGTEENRRSWLAAEM